MTCVPVSRFRTLAAGLVAVFALAGAARAQTTFGLHVARATDSFGGVNGVGGSIELNVPVLPVNVFFAGEYFFPDCDECSFWGGSADLHFALPIPVVTPYGTAGLVMRGTHASDTTVRTGGLGLGAGVHLGMLALGVYAEGRYELMDGSDDQAVFRLGLRF